MNIPFDEYITIVIHQTDLKILNLIKKMLASHNIAPEQALIMMLLWKQDGITQNEIAEELNKDKTNVARMLFILEQKDFIRRMTDKKDRRALNVHLTEKGKGLRQYVIAIVDEFSQIVCQGVTNEELLVMRKTLDMMGKNLQNALNKIESLRT